MKIFKEIDTLRALLKTLRQQGKSIGLVPTMGALHQGHLTLVKAAKTENDFVIVSIYVNPAQFNNPEDLARYPRTIDTDTKMLEEVRCDAVFCPSDTEMYPDKPAISIGISNLDNLMEGKFRPGHFSGVALVVSKLLNIVTPDKAYFGQKDWQQFVIISRLVADLKFDVQLRSISTVREHDGLAMSSRNKRLSEQQRSDAAILFRALADARSKLLAGLSIEEVGKGVFVTVNSTPSMKVEYFEVADSENLKSLKNVSEAAQPILCIAAFAGDVRLIDNMFLYADFTNNETSPIHGETAQGGPRK